MAFWEIGGTIFTRIEDRSVVKKLQITVSWRIIASFGIMAITFSNVTCVDCAGISVADALWKYKYFGICADTIQAELNLEEEFQGTLDLVSDFA